MPGPPPVPTRLKVLRGNPGHRRLSKLEPTPRREPACPEPLPFLGPHAQREWRRVGPELFELGLLTVLDTAAFGAYCAAYGHWVEAEEQLAESGALVVEGSAGSPLANPLLKIATQAARDLIRFGNEFGLTPSSRARLRAEPVQDLGKFKGLLAGYDG
jgi:P27 family predicted phage terminase small subunit